jgi:polysaccharide export outer membrane protein
VLKKLTFFALLAILSSCSTKKSVHYFQDSLKTESLNNYLSSSVQIGDILDISIKALDIESVSMFQSIDAGKITTNSLDVRKLNGYKVDSSGEIDLPLLGSIKVIDLTPNQISELLEQKLKSFVVSPAVKTMILNFKFSVLGEVKSPQTFSVIDDKISIIQAIGMAGDLTINGDRSDITLLREVNGKFESTIIDLTSFDVISSPYYNLRQNDVIYVRPNTAKVKSSGLVGNVGTLTSVLSLLLSLGIILTN